jgi:hypothetical protein
VQPCVNCLAAVNTTFAAAIEELAIDCGLPVTLPPAGAATTTGAATITPTPILNGNPTQCSNECGLISAALTSCTEDSCLCPTFLAQGPGCSSCFATVNATQASLLSIAISQCTATISNPISVCSAQCGLIFEVASSCGANNTCFCPTFLAQAPACSSCWATVSMAEASTIGELSSTCASLLYSSHPPAPPITAPTVALTPSSSHSASGAGSGFGEILGTSWIQFIMPLALVAGLLAVFG